jgi:hypothetical protein
MTITISQATKIAKRIRTLINSVQDPIVEDNIERDLSEIELGYKLRPAAYCDPVDLLTQCNLVKWIRVNTVPKY